MDPPFPLAPAHGIIKGESATDKETRAMTIAAILQNKGDVLSVQAETPVRDAVELLAVRRIGALPVLRGESVAGIMSERDVIYCLRSDGAAVLEWPVERIMTAPAITVTRDQQVLGALSLMTRRRIRHLPVVEDDRLIGIVSIGDLVKHRMDQIEREAEQMLNYIQSA
jgi:CBS domain-containing protein